jgi:hypothetical protein
MKTCGGCAWIGRVFNDGKTAYCRRGTWGGVEVVNKHNVVGLPVYGVVMTDSPACPAFEGRKYDSETPS